MIIVTGSAVSKPETHDALVALCTAHCARSRAEAGCIDHRVHADCENPYKLVFLEYWEDMEALQAHFQLPEARAFAVALMKLAAEPPIMRVYDANRVEISLDL